MTAIVAFLFAAAVLVALAGPAIVEKRTKGGVDLATWEDMVKRAGYGGTGFIPGGGALYMLARTKAAVDPTPVQKWLGAEPELPWWGEVGGIIAGYGFLLMLVWIMGSVVLWLLDRD